MLAFGTSDCMKKKINGVYCFEKWSIPDCQRGTHRVGVVDKSNTQRHAVIDALRF